MQDRYTTDLEKAALQLHTIKADPHTPAPSESRSFL